MLDRRSGAVTQAARADLLDRVGADRVLVGAAARDAIGGGEADEPIAVVRPADAQDVSAVLRVARARHLGVVPRSRLPANRPAALRGTVVLDCGGLDRPPAIDISRRVVTVGVAVAQDVIDRAARRARLALRATSVLDADQPIGALIAGGEGGELGIGAGELAVDLVSAVIVAGSGRVLTMSAAELLGHPPWAMPGLPNPAALMVGADGRLGVLIEVSLRLHPAPFAGWADVTLPAGRDGVFAALSVGRRAFAAGLCDSLLLDDAGDGSAPRAEARLCSLRDVDDLQTVAGLVRERFARQGCTLGALHAEPSRVRLGQEVAPPRWAPGGDGVLDVRVAWPDAPKVQDVVDALSAGAPTRRRWALGQDGVRLRLQPIAVAGRHPLLEGVEHLLDAGAVPVGATGAVRELLRDRMPSGAKVLLNALSRVWDPDEVLVSGRGPF